MIEEQFVSFDTAKLLKEAGFDVPVYKHYTKTGAIWTSAMPEKHNDKMDYMCFPCPTQALAARWLREVHGIHVYADMAYSKLMEGKWVYLIRFTDKTENPYKCVGWSNSYEEALEEGLREAIKLIKK